MNQIFIPIERVHLETVFERGRRTEYALLEPQGEVSPLRIRFEDLRRELSDRFSEELSAETIVERIARMEGEQLLVTVTLERGAERRWNVRIRARYPYEKNRQPVDLSELRRSPRHRLEVPKDVRVELGDRSLEGTVYNVSEHGLGIAVLTTQLEQLRPFKVDEAVEIVGDQRRVIGRIRSQYPAAGGCVLGIELKERLTMPGMPDIEA
jgi:PilZ domain-containing protein